MKTKTKQSEIAAEAVKQIEKCLPEGALRSSTSFVGLEVMAIQSIIQSAIEKAIKEHDKELGAPVPRKKIKRAKRRPSAFADIKKYRREHPGVGLTEAYQAVRGNLKSNPLEAETQGFPSDAMDY